MPYRCEEQLRKRAGEFIPILEKHGIHAEISQVYDYTLKLSVSRGDVFYGSLLIYCKETRGTFSLGTHELKDKSIIDGLYMLWEGKWTLPGIDRTDNAAEEIYRIYVDGSYMNGAAGYGAVILKNDQLLKEMSGPVTDSAFTTSRQVGGELTAVIEALKWCREKGIDRVSIFYDFENMQKWVTGEYAANTPMTVKYKEFIGNCEIDIKWHKVTGHTGVRWNERADELAREGAGAVENNVESALIEELEVKSREFVDFLNSNGYAAEFIRICNRNAAKIKVKKEDEEIGYINIYNTLKKHLCPSYHELKLPLYKDEFTGLWEAFHHKTDNC